MCRVCICMCAVCACSVHVQCTHSMCMCACACTHVGPEEVVHTECMRSPAPLPPCVCLLLMPLTWLWFHQLLPQQKSCIGGGFTPAFLLPHFQQLCSRLSWAMVFTWMLFIAEDCLLAEMGWHVTAVRRVVTMSQGGKGECVECEVGAQHPSGAHIAL